jgi:lipid-A-disaccharide synthase
MMVAGEASGDLHGAGVVRALRQHHPEIVIVGAGGSAMASAGATLEVRIETLSVMGVSAVLAKLPVILDALRRLKNLMSNIRPDLLILIDFPDFNLKLAAAAKKLGIPVLYYISPTIWAWRTNRIRKIQANVNHMAVILPFETEIFEKHRIPVTFVGHPLLDTEGLTGIDDHIDLEVKPFTLALLPGSREGEVKRLLPTMLDAVKILKRQLGSIQIVLSRAPSIPHQLIQHIISRHELASLEIVDSPVGQIFRRCHFAVIASGTASLEGALAGIPMVIVYKMSTLNYCLAKMLIKVPHIGLANLIAQKRIVPELIQKQASAEHIAHRIIEIINDPEKYKKIRSELAGVRNLMGKRGAAARVAHIADQLMVSSPVDKRSH